MFTEKMKYDIKTTFNIYSEDQEIYIFFFLKLHMLIDFQYSIFQ